MHSEKQRAIHPVYFMFFLFGSSATIIGPLIPWFSETLNIGYDKIGFIILIGPVFGIISVLTSGRMCDVWQIKKIILVGLILIMSGFLIIGISLTIITLIISLAFLKLGFGIIDTSGYAYTFRMLYGEHNIVFMRMEIFYWFGAILSPLLIGGILYINLNPKYIFLFFSISFLLEVFLFLKYASAENSKVDESGKNFGHDDFMINPKIYFLKDPVIIITAFMLLFYIGSTAGLSSWLTTYFLFFDMNVYQGSLVLSLYWVLLASGLFLTQKIIKKTNEITIILLGSIFGTITILIFGLVNILPVKLIFLAMNGFFISGISSMAMSIAVSQNPRRSGSIAGFIIAAYLIGEVLFQPILGIFAEYLGKKFIVYVIIAGFAITTILSFMLFIVLRNRNKAGLIIFNKPIALPSPATFKSKEYMSY